MSDETDTKSICENCKAPFQRDKKDPDGTQLHCSRCMIEMAEKYVPEPGDISHPKRFQQKRFAKVLFWIVLCVCLSIVAIQAPEFMSSFTQKTKPIRYGTYLTDKKTDACINNLWSLSKAFQEGKIRVKDFGCPVSQNPYRVIGLEDDTMIRCPTPERHGVKEIQISKKRPCPEIIE